MTGNLIRIRFRQTGRELQLIGLFKSMLLLLVLLPLFGFYIFKQLDKPGINSAIVAGVAFLILMMHSRRKDHNFLFKLTDAPFKVYLTEYLLLASPLILVLLVKGLFIQASGFAGALAIISAIVPKARKEYTYHFVTKLIPAKIFEWQSGIRKNLIALILIYAIGLLGLLNIWFVAASAFFLALVTSTFYSECEPVKILEAREKAPKQFLNSKLLEHSKLILISLLPLLLVACFHFEQILWIFIVLLVIMNFMMASVLLKYAYYIPGNTSGAHQFFCSVLLMASVIPPFSILIIVLNIVLFNKSVRNLNQYLHAYYQ